MVLNVYVFQAMHIIVMVFAKCVLQVPNQILIKLCVFVEGPTFILTSQHLLAFSALPTLIQTKHSAFAMMVILLLMETALKVAK
jgi:hypothetical protein